MDDNGYGAAAAAAEEEEWRLEWDRQLFSIKRSARYHARRAAFLDFVAKSINIVSMLAGFSVVASAIGRRESVYMAFGIAVAFLSMVNFIFDFPSKARLHAELKRRFAELEKSMVGLEPGKEAVSEKIRERLAIEVDEPAVVKTLDMMCHNDLVRAQGSGKPAEVGWLRSLFCQIDLPWIK
jgi:low affinity Fe/Cu permease